MTLSNHFVHNFGGKSLQLRQTTTGWKVRRLASVASSIRGYQEAQAKQKAIEESKKKSPALSQDNAVQEKQAGPFGAGCAARWLKVRKLRLGIQVKARPPANYGSQGADIQGRRAHGNSKPAAAVRRMPSRKGSGKAQVQARRVGALRSHFTATVCVAARKRIVLLIFLNRAAIQGRRRPLWSDAPYLRPDPPVRVLFRPWPTLRGLGDSDSSIS